MTGLLSLYKNYESNNHVIDRVYVAYLSNLILFETQIEFVSKLFNHTNLGAIQDLFSFFLGI